MFGRIGFLLLVVCAPALSAFAQDADKGPLDVEQQAILREFRRFEENLLKSAEATRKVDPNRAELLQRARGLSVEQRIAAEMERIAGMLGGENARLGAAAEQQDDVIASLESVLKLLQTENERDRLEEEKARIEELLKETDRLIAKQRDVRADTSRGQPSERLKQDQGELAEDADKLADKIDRHDRARNAENADSKESGDKKPGSESEDAEKGDKTPDDKNQSDQEKGDDQKKGDAEEGEKQNGEKDPKDGEKPSSDDMPEDGEKSPGAEKPNDGEKPNEGDPEKGGSKQNTQPPNGKPQDGQQSPPQEGSPEQNESPQQQTPGREELQNARQQMQKAIEELEKKKRESAGDAQDEAVAELEKLKSKLEEILRQLREEEEEILLAMLEARFQQMLQLQLRVNATTKRLAKTPDEERQGTFLTSTTELSRDQEDILLEATKTLRLLQEEGSSAAFPEAVDQMIGSMRQVVKRLQGSDVGNTTQLIEEMIVESLEEMIVALQKELEKKQEEKSNQQGSEQGGEQEKSLVDQMAELKLIRSLQAGVNRMTEQFDTALAEKGAEELSEDDREFLLDLARRQQRIQKITYELATKRLD